MKYVFIESEHLKKLADVIRSKCKTEEPIAISNMHNKINSISPVQINEIMKKIHEKTIEYANGNSTSIGDYSFYGCVNLKEINFNNALKIGTGAFNGCFSLVNVNLENITNIGQKAFARCSALEKIDLKNVSYIYNCFSGCQNLKTIILRKTDSICVYNNTYTGDDPTNPDLKIYVPTALLSSYQQATNWSRLASKFVSLEGSPYE